MLTARPHSIFSWTFDVSQGTHFLATLSLRWMREAGELKLKGQAYRIGREGLMSGEFFLELYGNRLASAQKPSIFLRRFEVSVDSEAYILRAASIFTRRFVLEREGKVVGTIRPAAPLTRRMQIDLPEELPLPARLFITWLVIVLWKRAASNN